LPKVNIRNICTNIFNEKIDMNKLLSELVENFYKTAKNIHENAAF